MTWFKARLSPENVQSEFDREEAEFRTKTAKAEAYEQGLSITGGFLKALTPVLITNLAIVLVLAGWMERTLPEEELREIERLSDISLLTLAIFVVSFPATVAVMRYWFTPFHVSNQREAEWANSKVQAVKAAIREAMGQYDGHMPTVKSTHFRRYILDDHGKIKRDTAREDWRQDSDIPPKMQSNFESAHPELVTRMDNLRDLVKTFYDEYDSYSEEFRKQYFLKTRSGGQTKPLAVDNHTKDAITSSFLFFSGEIQNKIDLQSAQNFGEIDQNTQKWLESFFEGDPSDASAVSSLQLNTDLKTKGKKASDEKAKAQHEWDEVRELVKETRAGRG